MAGGVDGGPTSGDDGANDSNKVVDRTSAASKVAFCWLSTEKKELRRKAISAEYKRLGDKVARVTGDQTAKFKALCAKVNELKAKLDEMQGEEAQNAENAQIAGAVRAAQAKLNEMPPNCRNLVSDLLSAISSGRLNFEHHRIWLLLMADTARNFTRALTSNFCWSSALWKFFGALRCMLGFKRFWRALRGPCHEEDGWGQGEGGSGKKVRVLNTQTARFNLVLGLAFERKLCGVLSADSFKRCTPIWDASTDVQVEDVEVEDVEVEEVEVDEDAEVLALRNMMVCCANLKGTFNENGMVAFSAQQPGFKVTDKQVAELIEKAHAQGDSRVEMYPWQFMKAAGARQGGWLDNIRLDEDKVIFGINMRNKPLGKLFEAGIPVPDTVKMSVEAYLKKVANAVEKNRVSSQDAFDAAAVADASYMSAPALAFCFDDQGNTVDLRFPSTRLVAEVVALRAIADGRVKGRPPIGSLVGELTRCLGNARVQHMQCVDLVMYGIDRGVSAYVPEVLCETGELFAGVEDMEHKLKNIGQSIGLQKLGPKVSVLKQCNHTQPCKPPSSAEQAKQLEAWDEAKEHSVGHLLSAPALLYTALTAPVPTNEPAFTRHVSLIRGGTDKNRTAPYAAMFLDLAFFQAVSNAGFHDCACAMLVFGRGFQAADTTSLTWGERFARFHDQALLRAHLLQPFYKQVDSLPQKVRGLPVKILTSLLYNYESLWYVRLHGLFRESYPLAPRAMVPLGKSGTMEDAPWTPHWTPKGRLEPIPVPCMGLCPAWGSGDRYGIPFWLPITKIAKHPAQNHPTTVISPFESFATLERKDAARRSGAKQPLDPGVGHWAQARCAEKVARSDSQ
eukprot:gene11353-18954_t